MTNSVSNEAIAAAVEWWADKLYACKQSGLSAEERASGQNRSYEFAEVLMALSKPKVTAEQVAKFKEHLTSYLTTHSTTSHWLDVDYHPNMILANALDAAEIDSGMGTLPIKTSMWIDNDTVTVRYGYGSPEERVYP